MVSIELPEDKARKLENLLNQISESRWVLYQESKELRKLDNQIRQFEDGLKTFNERKESREQNVTKHDQSLSSLTIEYVQTLIRLIADQDGISDELKSSIRTKVEKLIHDQKYNLSLHKNSLELMTPDEEIKNLLSPPEVLSGDDLEETEEDPVSIAQDNWIYIENSQ